jgi:hypothetical protein
VYTAYTVFVIFEFRILSPISKMEKSSDNKSENDGDAKSRKPRRLRNEDEPAQQKVEAPSADAGAKPRRRRATDNADGGEQGDGGWFGGSGEKKIIKSDAAEEEKANVLAT